MSSAMSSRPQVPRERDGGIPFVPTIVVRLVDGRGVDDRGGPGKRACLLSKAAGRVVRHHLDPAHLGRMKRVEALVVLHDARTKTE